MAEREKARPGGGAKRVRGEGVANERERRVGRRAEETHFWKALVWLKAGGREGRDAVRSGRVEPGRGERLVVDSSSSCWSPVRSTSRVRSSRIGRHSCRDSAQACGPAGTSTKEGVVHGASRVEKAVVVGRWKRPCWSVKNNRTAFRTSLFGFGERLVVHSSSSCRSLVRSSSSECWCGRWRFWLQLIC